MPYDSQAGKWPHQSAKRGGSVGLATQYIARHISLTMQVGSLLEVCRGEAVVVRRFSPLIPALQLVARLHNGPITSSQQQRRVHVRGPNVIALAGYLARGRSIACQSSSIIARLCSREERDQRGWEIVSSLVQKPAGVEMRVEVNLMRRPGGAEWGC